MALVILPGLNNLIEDISEEKKLPPNIVEAALREALLKGYEKYRKTFYIGVNEDPFDEEYFSNFDVGLDLDEEGYRILSSKIIVEEVESEDHQISLLEVKQVADDAQIGDTVVLDVTPEKEDSLLLKQQQFLLSLLGFPVLHFQINKQLIQHLLCLQKVVVLFWLFR